MTLEKGKGEARGVWERKRPRVMKHKEKSTFLAHVPMHRREIDEVLQALQLADDECSMR